MGEDVQRFLCREEEYPFQALCPAPFLLVEGRLAVPFYLIDCFHLRVMSQNIDISKADWADFAKNASVHL